MGGRGGYVFNIIIIIIIIIWGGGSPSPLPLCSDVDLFAEALSRSIGPPETAFESAHCEIHSGNLDKILTVY